MFKNDFLSWDDIELLTDEENYTEELIDDEDEIDNEKRTDTFQSKRPKTSGHSTFTKDKQSYLFQCPQAQCNKLLKTISGFHGHVEKQHGKYNLKGEVLLFIRVIFFFAFVYSNILVNLTAFFNNSPVIVFTFSKLDSPIF